MLTHIFNIVSRIDFSEVDRLLFIARAVVRHLVKLLSDIPGVG